MVQWFSSRFYEGMFVGFNKVLKKKNNNKKKIASQMVEWFSRFDKVMFVGFNKVLKKYIKKIASQMVQCFSSRFYERNVRGIQQSVKKNINNNNKNIKNCKSNGSVVLLQVLRRDVRLLRRKRVDDDVITSLLTSLRPGLAHPPLPSLRAEYLRHAGGQLRVRVRLRVA